MIPDDNTPLGGIQSSAIFNNFTNHVVANPDSMSYRMRFKIECMPQNILALRMQRYNLNSTNQANNQHNRKGY